MASDKDRSGTPADLGALPSLLPGRTGLADGNAPSSASFVAHSDSNDFTPFTDHLQHQFNQHDWAFTDAQMGHWSPGIDTLDSQFFATADAAALAFPMPTAPVAAVPGSVPLSLSAGFGAPDVSQEWADITTGFNAPNESITQGSSESPVDAMEGTDATDQRSKIPPKIGTRFSKESLRILRNWLSTHSRRPFPTDEERRLLQNQTGLTKTQILNWLANARRRGKVPEYQSSSPHVRSNAASPIPIPPRAATPAPQAAGTSHFDPLQRWVDSPPEHEPATAAAIARAVASSPPAGKIPLSNAKEGLAAAVSRAHCAGLTLSSKLTVGPATTRPEKASREARGTGHLPPAVWAPRSPAAALPILSKAETRLGPCTRPTGTGVSGARGARLVGGERARRPHCRHRWVHFSAPSVPKPSAPNILGKDMRSRCTSRSSDGFAHPRDHGIYLQMVSPIACSAVRMTPTTPTSKATISPSASSETWMTARSTARIIWGSTCAWYTMPHKPTSRGLSRSGRWICPGSSPSVVSAEYQWIPGRLEPTISPIISSWAAQWLTGRATGASRRLSSLDWRVPLRLVSFGFRAGLATQKRA